MIFEIPKQSVLELLIKQLKNFFPVKAEEVSIIYDISDLVFNKCEENFKNSPAKYYYLVQESGEREAYFSPFHSGQWTIFLYYLYRSIYNSSRNIITPPMHC